MGDFNESIHAIRGFLLAANFHEDEYTSSIYLEDSDECISSTFNADIEEDIAAGLRHLIYAIGIAIWEDVPAEKIKSFHIVKLFILDGIESYSQEVLEAALAEYRHEHDTIENFKRSWREVKTGETYPISELWNMIDDE